MMWAAGFRPIVAIAILITSCTASGGPRTGSSEASTTTGTVVVEPIDFATFIRQADTVLEIADVVVGELASESPAPFPLFSRRFEATVVAAPLIPSNVLVVPERLEFVERRRTEHFGIDEASGEGGVLVLIDGGGQLVMRPTPPLRVVLVVATSAGGSEVLGPQPFWDAPVDLDAAAKRYNETHSTDLTGTDLLVAWVRASTTGDADRFEEVWRTVRDER